MDKTLEPAARLQDSNVLITGGVGFIGAWLAAALVQEGNRVTLLDRAPSGGSSAAALGLAAHVGVHVVQGDVRDAETMGRLGASFDHIVHAASVLGVERVVQKPILTLDVNVRGTQVCLEYAATQRRLKRFLLISTSEVYGRNAVAARETDPVRLDSGSLRWAYAASKAAGEFLGRAFHAEHGVPVVIVRPFNVYGPHRHGDNAMTTLIGRAIRGEDLVISGDGSQRRAWCYISDFVDGLHRCLSLDAGIGETFNIGDDRADLSVLELARKIRALTGSRSRQRFVQASVPDVYARCPCIDKARVVLGYDPRAHLDVGILQVAYAMKMKA